MPIVQRPAHASERSGAAHPAGWYICRLLSRSGRRVTARYTGLPSEAGERGFAVTQDSQGRLRMAVWGPRGDGDSGDDIAALAATAARMSWRAESEHGIELATAPVDAYLYRRYGSMLAVSVCADIAGQEAP